LWASKNGISKKSLFDDYYFDETIAMVEISKTPDEEEATDATIDDLEEMGFNVSRGEK